MRCYSFLDILNKGVPSSENFSDVLNKIRRVVPTMADLTSWALVYGSAAGGTNNRASDVDLAIVWKPDIEVAELEQGILAIQEVRRFAKRNNVTIDVALGSEQDITTGSFGYGYGFSRHLKVSAEKYGMLLGKPDMISLDKKGCYEMARTYCWGKLRKAQTMNSVPVDERRGEIWYDWLSEVLTTWKYIELRVLEALDPDNCDTESFRQQLYQTYPSGSELIAYSATLNDISELYLDSLDKCLDDPNGLSWAYIIELIERVGGITYLKYAWTVYHEILCKLSP